MDINKSFTFLTTGIFSSFFLKCSFELYIEIYHTKRITNILANLLHKTASKKMTITKFSPTIGLIELLVALFHLANNIFTLE